MRSHSRHTFTISWMLHNLYRKCISFEIIAIAPAFYIICSRPTPHTLLWYHRIGIKIPPHSYSTSSFSWNNYSYSTASLGNLINSNSILWGVSLYSYSYVLYSLLSVVWLYIVKTLSRPSLLVRNFDQLLPFAIIHRSRGHLRIIRIKYYWMSSETRSIRVQPYVYL